MSGKHQHFKGPEVSCCVKYFLFGFNIVFWLLGAAFLAIGLWAWAEKQLQLPAPTGGRTGSVCKMADIDVRIRQRSVTEFLQQKVKRPFDFMRLKNVSGDATVDVSTVRRWVRRCNTAEGLSPLADKMRSGRPVTAVTPSNIHTTAEIVKIGWENLPHRPYSPDLAPSHFHLLGPLKEAHRGIHFDDDEAMKKVSALMA